MNGKEILAKYFTNEELDKIFDNTKYLNELHKEKKINNPYSINNIFWQFLPNENYSLDSTEFSSKDLFFQTVCLIDEIQWKFNKTTNGIKLHFNYESKSKNFNYGIIFSLNNKILDNEKYILTRFTIDNEKNLSEFKKFLEETTKKIYYDKDLYTRLYNSSLSSIMKIFTLPKQDFLIYLLYSIFYFEIK